MAEAIQSQPSPRETETPAQQGQPQLQPLPPAFDKSPTRFVQGPGSQVVQYAPFQPPPGFAQQQFEPQVEQARPWSKGWHVAKLALGTGSLVASVVVIAISIALIAKYADNEAYGYYDVLINVAIGLAIGGLAMLWITTEFLVLVASKTKHGMHPGASVSLHLIICLVTAAGIGLAATNLSWWLDEGPSDAPDDDGTGYYDGSAGSSIQNYDTLVLMSRLVETIIAFMSLLEVIHFVLLVRACVETHQYNKWKLERLATRTVYVQVPVPYGYYAPVPGQEQMVFQPVPAQQPQQSGQTTQEGPAAPAQALLYGYYAPGQELVQPAPQTRTVNPPAETANAVAGSSR